MKILLVHNSYQQPGGEDQVFAQEAELLTSHGHRVTLYQASNDQVTGTPPLVLLGKTIWNGRTYKELRTLMQQERPDIVHVHNAFPIISPAAYHAAKDEEIPVIKTLHNYRMVCPAATLFRDGHVCEECIGRHIPYPGILHKCYRSSRMATSASAAMLAIHHLKDTWTNTVDGYIALTSFARDKFIEGGFPAERIFIKPNYLHTDPGRGKGQGKYALFVGRLAPEKGIRTMLAAWRQINQELPLQIAGNGLLASEVDQASREIEGITWLKWLPRTDILQRMKDASMLILPSEWYEGFPMIIAEAFAVGLPVVSSNLGSLASIIDHHRTGLHFEAGNPDALVEAVRWFHSHDTETEIMRVQARAEYEKKYTAEVNYAQLMSIYEAVLSPHRKEQSVSVLTSAHGLIA